MQIFRTFIFKNLQDSRYEMWQSTFLRNLKSFFPSGKLQWIWFRLQNILALSEFVQHNTLLNIWSEFLLRKIFRCLISNWLPASFIFKGTEIIGCDWPKFLGNKCQMLLVIVTSFHTHLAMVTGKIYIE